MRRHLPALFSMLFVLAFAAPGVAFAHGEADESVEAFHEHLDDYRAELVAFADEVDAIVETYAADENVQPMIDALIERWEAVAVHGAIETKAMVVYPTIWQGIIGLQQAALEGRDAAAVAEAGEQLKAGLWQGFGALRLAAAQVDGDADGGHDHHHHEDGGDS